MSTDRGIPWRHAVRDLVLLAVTLGLWSLDASRRTQPGSASVILAIVTGAATAVCAYLLHEWGHLTAARLSGSFVRLPQSAAEVFLFKFDTGRNSRSQFATMSLGGFIASGISLWLLAITLPTGTLATRVAWFLAIAGVIATAVLELPPFWRVLRGGDLPTGAAFVSESEPKLETSDLIRR